MKKFLFSLAIITMATPCFSQTITKVSGGANHTLILKSDGTVWSFGRNNLGQLGDNTTTNSSNPIQVHGPGNVGFLTGIVDIAGGMSHSMALKNDGTVWCWGGNADGQIGDGTNTQRNTPVQVKGLGNTGFLSGVTAVSTSKRVSMALLSDSTIAVWGVNYAGQLADGGTTARNYPERVKGAGFVGYLTGVTKIRGNCCSCQALRNDGTVWMWGESQYGQLGRGFTSGTPANPPAPVCAVGGCGNGNLTNIVEIGGGSYHMFAVNSSGELFAWGLGATGALGNGSTSNINLPVQILTGVSKVAAGGDPSSPHGMTLKSDGTVWAWGYNASGELGNGNNTNQLTPVQITTNAASTVAIDCGWEHSLILKNDGSVCTVGENQYGQLGDGTLVDKNIFTCPSVLTGIETEITSSSYLQNYPNPWSSSTTIQYNLTGNAGKIILNDVTGRIIKEISLTDSSGEIIIAEKIPSGIYFYSLQENGRTVLTQKMIVY
jgi:alpha-tubulin suppressor-like RCC1 family protein